MMPSRLAHSTAPLLLLGLLLFGCKQGEEAKPEGEAPALSSDTKIVATVNGDPITLGEFQERFNRAGFKPEAGAEIEVIKRDFLNRLIERKMLLREAQRRRIKVGREEIEQRINQFRAEQGMDVKAVLEGQGVDYEKWKADIWENMMIEKLLSREINRSLSVSSLELRRYYQANPGEFEKPDQVRARQIVVSTEAEAEAVLEQLRSGADFAALAKQKSTAPEGANGGELGYFAVGEMPAEFNVVFALPKGGVSGVVKSPYGYHVFKLEDRRPAGRRSLEEVSEVIRQKLLQEKQEKRYKQWLHELRSRTKFEINYEALNY